jgi:hypothetical protein
MSMYKQFKTDEQLETEGVVVNYGDFRVTLARAGGGNKQFAKVLESMTRQHQKAIQMQTLSNEQADEILKTVYARTVIRNWEVLVDGAWMQGIENPEKGAPPLPFTEANTVAALTVLPEMFKDFKVQAESYAMFRAALREEAAGN